MNSTPSLTAPRLLRLVILLAVAAPFLAPALHAAKPGKIKPALAEADGAAETADAKAAKRDDAVKGKADRTNASDVEARKLARLRERLEVTDDTEWTLIAERIAKVEDLRRAAGAGAPGPRAIAASADKPKRNTRAGASANPEFDALKSAVSDKFPDAEIKARLSRMHDAYQQREAQLSQAQTELRSVLSVRQEAVMVMAGLLTP